MWSPFDEQHRDGPEAPEVREEGTGDGAPLLVLGKQAEPGEMFPSGEHQPVSWCETARWDRLPHLGKRNHPWSALLCQLPAPRSDRARTFLDQWRQRSEVPLLSFSSDRHAEASEESKSLGFSAHLACPFPRQGLLELLNREREWLRVRRRWRQARRLLWAEHRKLNVMREVAAAANSELDPDRVIRIVIDKARAILPFQTWSLFLMKEVENRLIRWQDPTEKADRALFVSQVISRWVVRKQSSLLLTCDGGRIRGFSFWENAVGPEVRSILCLPLRSRGRIIGALQLVNRQGGQSFTNQDLDLLQSLVEPASIAIENALLFRRAEELSVTDDLTGLYNFRFLHQFLHREVELSRRKNLKVSLIFLDMDGFKAINDQHGHISGARALVEIGDVIRRTVRTSDFVSRFGGDEFAVILPATDAKGAVTIAERVRRRIEESVLLEDMGIRARVTASIGVATFPDHARNKDELIGQADRAMYAVKGRNKNAVEVVA